MKIVTSEQMRRIEDRSEEAGVSKDTLMENAGLAIAKRVRHHVGYLVGTPLLILVGPGNNGGDGLVVARHLHAWGARVTIYVCRDRPSPDLKLDLVKKLGVNIVNASEDGGLVKLKELLAKANAVVDSVLGTGTTRPLEGILREIFLALNSSRQGESGQKLIAVDLPTGLNADTGEVDPACPRADVTVTLGHPKVGHFQYPGADYVGRLEIEDIGLPAGLDDDVGLRLMDDAWANGLLPSRPSASHKGSFGSALVVAGSRNYVGAAYLAGAAATRAGAGLVTIALPESLQSAVAARATEPTYLPLPESSPGVVSPAAARVILDAAPGYEALLIGCGLGLAADTVQFVESILYSGERLPPTIVDADGLNILSKTPEWWAKFNGPAVLTPHPGEMSRLTGSPTSVIQTDRIETATTSAKSWNKIAVLKGAFTVVAMPGGGTMLSPFANPGLASAGTGDVLAGTIAGLLSQGMTLEDAAALGVYIHGAAGDRVRDDLGDTGMIASDLLPELPRVIKALRTRA
ncbi:MAG: NAD(P)H-hydrate dehydratase [Chloroflexi bacterium]|nr:NAD(P)H-hydrate dehydratase [Chloroflexota bacterium]